MLHQFPAGLDLLQLSVADRNAGCNGEVCSRLYSHVQTMDMNSKGGGCGEVVPKLTESYDGQQSCNAISCGRPGCVLPKKIPQAPASCQYAVRT